MAVDYGLKKIGVALTDQLQIIAQPFCIIQNISLQKSAHKIIQIAHEKNVIKIVLGLPLNMNGSYSKMTDVIYKFRKAILFLTDIDVVTFDERLTTQQTKKILKELGINNNRKKYQLLEDKIAATLLLQTYLELLT
jgi:putative Holliday junction resolvase